MYSERTVPFSEEAPALSADVMKCLGLNASLSVFLLQVHREWQNVQATANFGNFLSAL